MIGTVSTHRWPDHVDQHCPPTPISTFPLAHSLVEKASHLLLQRSCTQFIVESLDPTAVAWRKSVLPSLTNIQLYFSLTVLGRRITIAAMFGLAARSGMSHSPPEILQWIDRSSNFFPLNNKIQTLCRGLWDLHPAHLFSFTWYPFSLPTLLQPQWPSFWVSNKPSRFLHQNFCINPSLCVESSLPNSSHGCHHLPFRCYINAPSTEMLSLITQSKIVPPPITLFSSFI